MTQTLSWMNAEPKGKGMRGWIDAVARWLARLLVAVFYRDVEIRGLENVPAEGPVLFVANHGNALVDPMVLVAALPRMPRFLAKSTLWSNPAVWPLLSLGGAVPVYRAQDGSTARNEETFSRCHEVLARGGAIALFPEGISHDEPSLQPLRTGAARIALGARASGAAPVKVVPVGLTFEEKGLFRSRLLVAVGAPLDAGDPRPEDAEQARELTRAIDDALRVVTLNTDSWEKARLLERAAELYAGESERALPGQAALGDRFSLRHRFGENYERTRAEEPERMESLENMARRYEVLLEAFRLRDDHVTSDYPWSHVLGTLGYGIPMLLLNLPFALLGLLLNYLPYRAPGWVASFVADQGDQPATYKVLTGFFGFPIFWALEAAIAGSVWGLPAALATLVIAPATGWVALRFGERNASFWLEARAYLTLRLAPHRARELRVLRGMLRDELKSLVEISSPPETGLSD